MAVAMAAPPWVGTLACVLCSVGSEWCVICCLGGRGHGVVNAAAEACGACHDTEGDGDEQGGDDDGDEVRFHEDAMLRLPIAPRNLSLPTVSQGRGEEWYRFRTQLSVAFSAACGDSELPMLPRNPVLQETKKMTATINSAIMMMGARYTLMVSPW